MSRGFRAERRDWIGTGGLSIPADEAIAMLEFVAEAAGSSYQSPDEGSTDIDGQSGRFVFFEGTKTLNWLRSKLRTPGQLRTQLGRYRKWHYAPDGDEPNDEDLQEFLAQLERLEPEWRRAIIQGEDQLELLPDWY